MAFEKNNQTKAHCNRCHGNRNHKILFFHEEYDEPESTDSFPYDFTNKYELIQCCGCDTISLRHTWWVDGVNDESGNLIINSIYYPPSISRPRPNWYRELFKSDDTKYIKDLLDEIYIGLQNDATRLATMGIRALLEFIMIQKVGDNGSFTRNIDEFKNKGYISKGQKKILEIVLETGHATIHRAHTPSKDDLSTCMDITESVIETIYIHPLKVKGLTKKISKK